MDAGPLALDLLDQDAADLLVKALNFTGRP